MSLVESPSLLAETVVPINDADGVVAFDLAPNVIESMRGILRAVRGIADNRDCSHILEGGDAFYRDETTMFVGALTRADSEARDELAPRARVGVLDAIQISRYLMLLQANPKNRAIYEEARVDYQKLPKEPEIPNVSLEEVSVWYFVERYRVEQEWARYRRECYIWERDTGRTGFGAAAYILNLHQVEVSH